MSASAPSPAGFNLYDLLTRVTPGVFLIGIFIVATIDWAILRSLRLSSTISLLTLFGGFLIGELVDSIRMSWFAAPKPFRYLLYAEWKNEPDSPNRFPRLRQGFLMNPVNILYNYPQDRITTELENKFDISSDLRDSDDVYLRLYTLMDSELTPVAHRYQTTTIFLQNMRIATVLGAGVIAFSGAVPDHISGDWATVILFVLLIFWLFLFYFDATENTYVRLLLLQVDAIEADPVEQDSEQQSILEFH